MTASFNRGLRPGFGASAARGATATGAVVAGLEVASGLLETGVGGATTCRPAPVAAPVEVGAVADPPPGVEPGTATPPVLELAVAVADPDCPIARLGTRLTQITQKSSRPQSSPPIQRLDQIMSAILYPLGLTGHEVCEESLNYQNGQTLPDNSSSRSVRQDQAKLRIILITTDNTNFWNRKTRTRIYPESGACGWQGSAVIQKLSLEVNQWSDRRCCR